MTKAIMDLPDFIERQKAFSESAFGPGNRTKGVSDHIRKELVEVAEAGDDALAEWTDVILLALDGAWRCGASPEAICLAMEAKLFENKSRTWPDWRTVDPDKAIEHVKLEQGQMPDFENWRYPLRVGFTHTVYGAFEVIARHRTESVDGEQLFCGEVVESAHDDVSVGTASQNWQAKNFTPVRSKPLSARITRTVNALPVQDRVVMAVYDAVMGEGDPEDESTPVLEPERFSLAAYSTFGGPAHWYHPHDEDSNEIDAPDAWVYWQ